jgi:hypothetical protein
MRGIQPNLRASSSYVEPERMCGLHRRAGAARRILVLVTSRRFPPPWTVEERAKPKSIGAAKARLLSPPHVDTLYVPTTQSRSY